LRSRSALNVAAAESIAEDERGAETGSTSQAFPHAATRTCVGLTRKCESLSPSCAQVESWSLRCQLPLSEAVHPELFRARLVSKQLNVAAAHTPPFLRPRAYCASPKARRGRSARSSRLKKSANGGCSRLNPEAAHTPPFLRRHTKLNLAAAVTPPYLKERLSMPKSDDSAEQYRKRESGEGGDRLFGLTASDSGHSGRGEIDPSDVWLNSNICRL
jgi:hypothetical protein